MSNAYSGPFADTLQNIDKGRLHAELTDALAELVAQVMQSGKPAKLTLGLAIKLVGRRSDMVHIAGSVGKKLPEPEPHEALFYATEDGALSRHDPSQPELPFRTLDKGSADGR